MERYTDVTVLKDFGKKYVIIQVLAVQLSEMISHEQDFEILAPVTLNVVCFRFKPGGLNEEEINRIK